MALEPWKEEVWRGKLGDLLITREGVFAMSKGYESSVKDKAADKRKGIKEGGKKDKAMDAKAKKKLRK